MSTRQVLAAAMSEAVLQRSVLDLARSLGWRAVHFRPAVERSGRWSTPMSGDKGWPDTVLVKDGRLIVAELKSQTGRVEPAQRAWLDELKQVPNIEVYTWRPEQWLDGTIQRVLSGGG